MSTKFGTLRALELFGLVRRRLNLLATQELKPLGIGPKQAIIIRFVAQHPECSLASVARATASDPAAVGRAIDSLVGSHWLSKREHPSDRRQWLLDLTPEGARKARKVEDVTEALSERLARALEPAERQALEKILTKIDQHLSEEQP